jgi:hypothetical protein
VVERGRQRVLCGSHPLIVLTIDFFGKTPAQHSQDGRFFGLKSGKLISQLVFDCLFYFQNELAIQIRCQHISLTLANSEQAYRPRGMRNMGSLSTIS